jgi:hypothetical protein
MRLSQPRWKYCPFAAIQFSLISNEVNKGFLRFDSKVSMEISNPNLIKISYNVINRFANLPTGSKKFCNLMAETVKIKKVFQMSCAHVHKHPAKKN